MIPQRYIQEWKEYAPWQDDAQVEQDLIITRTIVTIFSDDFLKEHLAFRGGTALYKIYLKPPPRYSEDIDFVQIKAGAIGNILDRLREVIDFFDDSPKIKVKANNNNIIFRFDSEMLPKIPMRLKIEINCREHFSVLGYTEKYIEIKNSWFSGASYVKTFELEELLATKLRALYQRKKGRDLFDLYYAFENLEVNSEKLLYCYFKYIKNQTSPSSKEFISNLEKKMEDEEFLGDISGLIKPDIKYNHKLAFEFIKKELLEKI